ncbi:MAG: dockerin type I domain-containing protein [Candidatus Zixiibacteriota bacterium]
MSAFAEDTLPHPITTPVSGVIFGFSMSPLGLTPVLEAGRDTSGSLRLIVDLPMTSGQFEIDTTCASLDADPNHSLHLEFFDTGQEGPPAFDRGTITVILCDCPYQSDLDSNGSVDAVDLAGEIDVVFFGEGDPQDPDCPATRSDFNADGTPDAVDLALLIDHVFFGGSGPISPCEW